MKDKIKVVASGCWEWLGELSHNGYGRLYLKGKKYTAHRFYYELVRGIIPTGKQLDHLCRNRKCVNPFHLEPVTARENLLRGNTHAAKNSKKTHCKNGHPFTPENIYLRKGNKRECRACWKGQNDRNKEYRKEWYKNHHTISV